jgi:hypothetical protein
VAGANHALRGFAHAQERPSQVRRDDSVERVDRVSVDGRRRALDARVVHQDVDASVPLVDLPKQLGHRDFVRHVCWQRRRLWPCPAGHLLGGSAARLRVKIDDHLCAGCAEGHRDGAADARAGPGHQGNPVRQGTRCEGWLRWIACARRLLWRDLFEGFTHRWITSSASCSSTYLTSWSVAGHRPDYPRCVVVDGASF